MKRIYSVLLSIGMLSATVSSCEKNDQVNDNGNPFKNGSSERNEIVIISDLHMGADLAYAELSKNLEALGNFLRNIKASPNVKELVIAGDLMDEWFVPATINTYNGKGQSDFVQRFITANKPVVDVFNSIIKEGKIKVTYVPGNHDLTITAESIEQAFPGINQARDNMLGLGTYSPADLPELAIEHGHRYNYFCAPDMLSNQDIAPGTILPPGYFFTRIAALHVIQNCNQNTDPVPELTLNSTDDESQNCLLAYSKIWHWTLTSMPINNHFNEDIIVTDINGFTGTYSVNDLFPYQASEGGVIGVNLFNGAQDNWDARQTCNNVAVHIPTEHAISNANSADETDYQAMNQYFNNPGCDKRIVVFGHNHRATIIPAYNNKGLSSIYANSGTWIDSNPGFSTANFVIITPQGEDATSLTTVELYNFEDEIYTKMAMNTVRL